MVIKSRLLNPFSAASNISQAKNKLKPLGAAEEQRLDEVAVVECRAGASAAERFNNSTHEMKHERDL